MIQRNKWSDHGRLNDPVGNSHWFRSQSDQATWGYIHAQADQWQPRNKPRPVNSGGHVWTAGDPIELQQFLLDEHTVILHARNRIARLASRNGVNIRLERCPLRSHLLYAGRKFS